MVTIFPELVSGFRPEPLPRSWHSAPPAAALLFCHRRQESGLPSDEATPSIVQVSSPWAEHQDRAPSPCVGCRRRPDKPNGHAGAEVTPGAANGTPVLP